MPFDLGSAGNPNVVLVAGSPVTVSVGERPARYLVFLHQVEDRASNYLTGFADTGVDGNELGDHVADYVLRYADGSEHVHPIRRRFAIQQARIGWGASAFAAVPMYEDRVVASAAEDEAAGRLSTVGYGRGETRHGSGRDGGRDLAWLYALPNPHPDRPIDAVELRPGAERCAVYAIAATDLTDHPLRPGTRRKLRLDVPPGASFGADRQLAGLELDLGTIISARPALDYDHAGWTDGDGATAPDVQPAVSATRALVEYAAHPDAKLHAGGRAYPLRELEDRLGRGGRGGATGEDPRRGTRLVSAGRGAPSPARRGRRVPSPEGEPPHRQRQLVRGTTTASSSTAPTSTPTSRASAWPTCRSATSTWRSPAATKCSPPAHAGDRRARTPTS